MKRNHLALLACSSLSVFASSYSADSAITPVRRELSPDALFYTHIDLEGGWEKIGRDLNTALKGTSLENRDFSAAFATSGLLDIRALGLSSDPAPGGYDNRFFLSTPGGRTGLLSIFPGKPEPFAAATYAPVDADLVFDARLDVAALIDTVQALALQLSSDRLATGNLITKMHKQAGENGEAFLKFKGRLAVVVRLHAKPKPGEGNDEAAPVAPVDVFASADSGGAALDKALSKQKMWTRTENNGQVRFTANLGQGETLIAITGEKIAAGLPATFVDECLNRKDGLATSPDFQQMLADTAKEGHMLTYATPKIFTAMREGMPFLSMLAAQRLGQSRRGAFANQFLSLIPLPTKPVISVLVARDDGILVRSRAPQSLKESLPFVSLLLPEFLGRISTIGATTWAVQDRHEQAHVKVQAELAGRLQQVGEAAAAYFEKHPAEVTTVTLSALKEASPGVTLPDFSDATDDDLEISRYTDLIVLHHREVGDITHVLPLTAARRGRIEQNLRTIASTGLEYLLLNDESGSVSASSLFDDGWLEKPLSVAGEDYTPLSIAEDVTQFTVTTTGSQEVTIDRGSDEMLRAHRAVAERQFAVERNLARLDQAAQAYFAANADESSIDLKGLHEKDVKVEITPVKDEDYSEITVYRSNPEINISSHQIGRVTYLRPLAASLQKEFTARLTAAEKAVALYFKNDPKADFVLIGEVFKDTAESREPVTEVSDSAQDAIKPGFDLSAVIVRHDYKNIVIDLDENYSIEVPRSNPQP